jgi:hypothetical protein
MTSRHPDVSILADHRVRWRAVHRHLPARAAGAGSQRRYWGEERFPILCDARPSITRLQPRWLAGEG